jgi:cytochrome P450
MDQPGSLGLLELDQVTEGAPLTLHHFPKLGYLDAVVKETLRLHPVILAAVRWVSCPVNIGGYDLPEQVIVAPCSYLGHRRPENVARAGSISTGAVFGDSTGPL